MWSRFKLVKEIHRAKERKVVLELLDKARNFFSIFFYRNIATIFLREREKWNLYPISTFNTLVRIFEKTPDPLTMDNVNDEKKSSFINANPIREEGTYRFRYPCDANYKVYRREGRSYFSWTSNSMIKILLEKRIFTKSYTSRKSFNIRNFILFFSCLKNIYHFILYYI